MIDVSGCSGVDLAAKFEKAVAMANEWGEVLDARGCVGLQEWGGTVEINKHVKIQLPAAPILTARTPFRWSSGGHAVVKGAGINNTAFAINEHFEGPALEINGQDTAFLEFSDFRIDMYNVPENDAIRIADGTYRPNLSNLWVEYPGDDRAANTRGTALRIDHGNEVQVSWFLSRDAGTGIYVQADVGMEHTFTGHIRLHWCRNHIVDVQRTHPADVGGLYFTDVQSVQYGRKGGGWRFQSTVPDTQLFVMLNGVVIDGASEAGLEFTNCNILNMVQSWIVSAGPALQLRNVRDVTCTPGTLWSQTRAVELNGYCDDVLVSANTINKNSNALDFYFDPAGTFSNLHLGGNKCKYNTNSQTKMKAARLPY